MDPTWLELGELSSFPEGKAVLRKAGGLRLACVRIGGAVHALDDACPHQGYPLSQGAVRDGVLTCAYHNWKFDVATGGCSFGGEPVRRLPTLIEAGRVLVSPAVDVAAEAARLSGSLRVAIADADPSRALREALRLAALHGEAGLARGFALLLADGARRERYGFDHGLALALELSTWARRGTLGHGEAFFAAAAMLGELTANLPERARSEASPHELDDPSLVAADLIAERRGDAEARVRHLARTQGARAAAAALAPFAARHLYDYGHGAIFLAKALELAENFPEVAGEALASSCVALSWATAETALPPFTRTREALEAARAVRPGERPLPDRAGHERRLLVGEREAVGATLERLAEGCDPRALLVAGGHAAAQRLLRFDPSWERRLDAEVTVLDVTHAVTFAEAAQALARLSPADAPALAVQLAGFVGKLRKADRSVPGPGVSSEKFSSSPAASLAAACQARDLPAALGLALELAAGGQGDGRSTRLEAYGSLAPFCAFDAAVRPIFAAHTVKTCEALARLDEADEADEAEAGDPGARAYLPALVAYVTPRRPERFVRRAAHVAATFLADGRPPGGLY
jgi:nitrite reductase/ring-hydroxylating ferredoxin subunit